MSSDEFRALAEFRYQIRQFLNGSEQAARAAGLEPQQYLFLLALRGLPAGREATIRELAERMQLRGDGGPARASAIVAKREVAYGSPAGDAAHDASRGEDIVAPRPAAH